VRRRTERDLTALADGALSGRRRERLEAEMATSPELQAAHARQRRAREAVRALQAPAPSSLRARIEGARPAPAAPRRRLGFGAALAGAAAAVVLALALTLPGGAGGPSVVEAAELSTRQPTEPAPRAAGPTLLDASAEGLPFPDWAERFGWRAIGERRDEIDGREAVTVFYSKEGRTIAYTIVSGDALDPPGDAGAARRADTRFRFLDDDGRTIVTWEREGHTCVLSGSGVETAKLLDLAAWPKAAQTS
jgi:anti-sigma factor RsiW